MLNYQRLVTTPFPPMPKVPTSRGSTAPLDAGSRVASGGGDRRKVRASEAELKRSSGAGAKSRCNSWGNQVSWERSTCGSCGIEIRPRYIIFKLTDDLVGEIEV